MKNNELIKKCKICLKDKPRDEFPKHSKNSWRSFCKMCYAQQRKEREQENQNAQNKKISFERKFGINRAKYIWKDYRNTDRIRGMNNNISKDFIENLIRFGCSYCGETSMSIMSLDRIDNSIGHITTNVVACCLRCNFIKKNMPSEAWIFLVPHIKQAYKLGLFGEWVGGLRKKNTLTIEFLIKFS